VFWTTDVHIKKENLCRYSMARINIYVRNTDFAGFCIFQVIYVRGVMKWYLGPHMRSWPFYTGVHISKRSRIRHQTLQYTRFSNWTATSAESAGFTDRVSDQIHGLLEKWCLSLVYQAFILTTGIIFQVASLSERRTYKQHSNIDN